MLWSKWNLFRSFVLTCLLQFSGSTSFDNLYLSHNPKHLMKIVLIKSFPNACRNTEINNQPVNLNHCDNNNHCCHQSQLINGSCIAVWINYDLNCLCNLLFLIEYSACHHCWDVLSESWGLCVPTRNSFFFTFKKIHHIISKILDIYAESQLCCNQQNKKKNSNDECHNITNTIWSLFFLFFVHLAGITQIQQPNKVWSQL